MIERKVGKDIQLTFLSFEHWQAWRDLKNDAWAKRVSLGHSMSISGQCHTQSWCQTWWRVFNTPRGRMKIEYTIPSWATVRGILLKIMALTIQQVLRIVRTRTPRVPKSSNDLDPKYMAMFGFTRAGHNSDGTISRVFLRSTRTG